MLIWSKRVTLSDLVQSATRPAPVNVRSVVECSVLPLNVTVKRSFSAFSPSACHWLGAHFNVRSCEALPPALQEPGKAHIVLERIRAHEVVIVRRCQAHRNAAGLVDASGDR